MENWVQVSNSRNVYAILEEIPVQITGYEPHFPDT